MSDFELFQVRNLKDKLSKITKPKYLNRFYQIHLTYIVKETQSTSKL